MSTVTLMESPFLYLGDMTFTEDWAGASSFSRVRGVWKEFRELLSLFSLGGLF